MDINFENYKKQITKLKEYDNSTDNIFKILHQETYENKHSIFLSWLLNPVASHGLDSKFAQDFFDKIAEINNKKNNIKASEIKNIILEKRIDGENQKKQKKDKRRIDILIEGSDFVYVIENKYGTSVHGGQCKDYRDYVEKEGKYKKCKNKNYVFLDIKMPKDFEEKHETDYANYDFISYNEIMEILGKYENKKAKNPREIFINQYLGILKELYGSTEENSKIKEICENISLDEILKICAITDEDYESLEFDQKRFVDVVRIYYQIKKDEIDNMINDALKKIAKDENFFKNDYGLKKQMYGHTIPVSFEFIDKADYLYKNGKMSKDEKAKFKELISKKTKTLSLDEKKEKKKICAKIETLINPLKASKEDKGNNNIPFQTIDFVAPHSECNNISIDIYAGLVPRYSKYLCGTFTKDQADQLFALTSKGWEITTYFYIRNGSGVNYVKLDKNEKAEKKLNITRAEELMNILEIGKHFYSGGIQKNQSELRGMKKILSPLNNYLNENDKPIEDFLEDCCNKANLFLLGFTIIMKYTIKEKDWNEEILKKMFYYKTLEGTKVFKYDAWFEKNIFRPENELFNK